MSKWAYVGLLVIPLLFAWDVSKVHPETPALFEAGLVASGLIVLAVYQLIEIQSALRMLRQQAFAPKVQRLRDYYAVEVFTVSTAGRELVQGDKAAGYHVNHAATGKLERAVIRPLGDDDDTDFRVSWAEKGGSEWASREILIFDDYTVATACAQEISERNAYPDLAREVSLRVVSGEDKRRARRKVGNFEIWSRRWPTKFWEAELAV